MNLEMKKDSRNKWNILDKETGLVVIGNIANKKLALDVMKKYKAPEAPVGDVREKMSRKERIRHDRAKQMNMSYSDYVSKYCVGN